MLIQKGLPWWWARASWAPLHCDTGLMGLIWKLSGGRGCSHPLLCDPPTASLDLGVVLPALFPHTRLTYFGDRAYWHGCTILWRAFQHWKYHLKIKRFCLKMQISSFASKTWRLGNTESCILAWQQQTGARAAFCLYWNFTQTRKKVFLWAAGG